MNLQKKVISIIGIFCVIADTFIMISCSPQYEANLGATSSALFTETKAVSSTATLPPTLCRQTVTSTTEPTENIFVPKKEIFNYSISGEHSFFEGPYEVTPENKVTRLVIYEDGQMIITGVDVKQKFMTQEEVSTFINVIESYGFSSIQTNGKSNPSDPLYDFGTNYEEVSDSPFYCVSMDLPENKTICYEDAYFDYLVPQMKEVISYLNNYHLDKLALYIPDRILLGFTNEVELSEVPNDAVVYKWDSRFPDPEGGVYGQHYISGDLAGEIAKLVNSQISVYVMNHEKYYHLIIRYILPHEDIEILE